MHMLAEAGRSLWRILRDALRVLARHWPALAALYLFGAAARGGFLWLAVRVSATSSLAATLVIPFASLSMLIAMVLMLRAVAPTLPALAGSTGQDAPRRRFRADLTVAVQVLVPFLAVYASQGLLRADTRTAIYDATTDEWMSEGFSADFGRFSNIDPALDLAVIVIALVLRKVIAGFDLGARNVGIAGFAGYLEALWLVTLATGLSSQLEHLKTWVSTRLAIVRIGQVLRGALDVLGPVGSAIQTGIDQVGAILSSMGSLVIVPVAWMALGATIYGTSLPDSKPLATSEQMTTRIRRIPQPMRRAAAQVVEPVVSPFRNTLTAIGRIAVAGVLPMVLLCLVLAAASHVRMLTVQVLRLLIGPQTRLVAYALSSPVDMVARGVYTVMMVALLASAVNTIVLRQREQAAPGQRPVGIVQ